MAKRRVNEPGLNYLKGEVQHYQKEVGSYRQEIEKLRNDRMMLLSALEDLTSDENYWSEEAIKSGIVWRLKNVLNNLKSS